MKKKITTSITATPTVETVRTSVNTPLVGSVTAGITGHVEGTADTVNISPAVLNMADADELAFWTNEPLRSWPGVQVIRPMTDATGKTQRFIVETVSPVSRERVCLVTPKDPAIEGVRDVIGLVVLVVESTPPDQFDAMIARCEKMVENFLAESVSAAQKGGAK